MRPSSTPPTHSPHPKHHPHQPLRKPGDPALTKRLIMFGAAIALVVAAITNFVPDPPLMSNAEAAISTVDVVPYGGTHGGVHFHCQLDFTLAGHDEKFSIRDKLLPMPCHDARLKIPPGTNATVQYYAGEKGKTETWALAVPGTVLLEPATVRAAYRKIGYLQLLGALVCALIGLFPNVPRRPDEDEEPLP